MPPSLTLWAPPPHPGIFYVGGYRHNKPNGEDGNQLVSD